MSEYYFLRKCRGKCGKGKIVSELNCIGVNPQHKDCLYGRQFKQGFCPYYIPELNEKNYLEEYDEVEGKRYYRQPFTLLFLYSSIYFK